MAFLEWMAVRLGCVPDIDSTTYIAMAEGRCAEVLRPFANRVLGPTLAHCVGFEAVQTAAVALFAASVACLLRRAGVSLRRALPFLCAPWVLSFACNIYMPDMLTSALTALMLLAFARFGAGAALPLLALMVTARESSLVVAAVWLLLLGFAYRKERKDPAARRRILLTAGGVAVSVAAGLAFVRVVSASSPGEINGLGIFYMPIKALVNGVASLTGLYPWHDVYARDLPQFYTHAPVWKTACPAFLRLGRFTEIGIYEWHPLQILATARVMLLEFGILVPYALFRRRAVADACRAPFMRLAALSGLAYWLVTPVSGLSPHRYIGYAWPLFWLAPLALLQREPPRRRLVLAVAHFALLALSRFVFACV